MALCRSATQLPPLARPPPLPPRGPAIEYDPAVWPPFLLSPFYYIVLGVALTVAVGAAVSGLVRGERTRRGLAGGFGDLPHADLLSPPIARLVWGPPERRRQAGDGPIRQGATVEQQGPLYEAVPLKGVAAASQAAEGPDKTSSP